MLIDAVMQMLSDLLLLKGVDLLYLDHRGQQLGSERSFAFLMLFEKHPMKREMSSAAPMLYACQETTVKWLDDSVFLIGHVHSEGLLAADRPETFA